MGRIVHMFKSIVALVLVHSGILRGLHRLRRPHVLIIAYHRVTPDADVDTAPYPAMHVSMTTFEAQLQALRRLYRPIPMADLHAILSGTMPLRESVVVVTFDDGYRDNFQNALPILTRQEVPATFFLAVDFVDRGRPFWFDALAAGMQSWNSGKAQAERQSESLAAPLRTALAGAGHPTSRLREAAAALKTLPDAEREAAVRGFVDGFGSSAAPSGCEPIRWDEVRTMCARGMNIGAHGVRHGILTRMSPDAAEQEIRQSVETISTRLGEPVRDFAYPNGDVDDEVARRAARNGVRLAFTMKPCTVRPGDDPHRLGRRNMCEDTSRSAFRRFSTAYFLCEITGVFDVLMRRGARGG